MDDEEMMLLWQDTLDEISAGRTSGLKCPVCTEGALEITRRGRFSKVSCKKCGKFVEGQFGSQD